MSSPSKLWFLRNRITELTNFKIDEEDSTMGWNLGRSKTDVSWKEVDITQHFFFFLTEILISSSFPQYFLTIFLSQPLPLLEQMGRERIAGPENPWSWVEEDFVFCSPFCRIMELPMAETLLDQTLVIWSLSHVRLFVTLWTIAHQDPLSIGFPGKNIGVGCYFLLQGIFMT